MKHLIWVILKLLPDDFVSEINAASLDELDERGLIIWRDEEYEAAIRETATTQTPNNEAQAD